jgi:hypothetical protein
MKLSAVKAAGALVIMIGFILWLFIFMRRGLGRLLVSLGAVSLGITAMAHLCGALRLFPAMGWDQPQTPGHYLHLDSLLAGVVLLTAGFVSALRKRREIF